MELGNIVRPDPSESLKLLVELGSSRGGVKPVMTQFAFIPAGAHTKNHPAFGDQIQRRDLFGGEDDIPLSEKNHAGGQSEGAGRRRCGSEGYERVKGAIQVGRQWSCFTVGPRGHDRHVRVLADDRGVKPAFLHRSPEAAGRDATIGDESDNTEFHSVIPIFVVVTGAGQTRTQAHICGTNSI